MESNLLLGHYTYGFEHETIVNGGLGPSNFQIGVTLQFQYD